MPLELSAVVRKVCLSFPESQEVLSHGAPDFRVRGKTYAMYLINHHGDGRIALWINSPAGAQQQCVRAEPKHFFVPPYVGPRGWLGVQLDKGISWKRIAQLVREAYEKVAPPALSKSIGTTIEIKGPVKKMSAEEFDPLSGKRAQAVIRGLKKIVSAFPEVSEDKQFGRPVWRAGKRVFAMIYPDKARLLLAFWVGVEHQTFYTADKRFHIPAYMGHNGWIALDVKKTANWKEIAALASGSYRHFALARMLKRADTRITR